MDVHVMITCAVMQAALRAQFIGADPHVVMAGKCPVLDPRDAA